ncbi:hypothetical protein ABPG74_019954 [Tetrahymena malaccensis]
MQTQIDDSLNSTTKDDLNFEKKRKENEQIDQIYQKKMKVYYQVLGDTGGGKSSFIKKVTGNQNVQTSNQRQSHTQECQIFDKDGKHYIDSPGINDTQRDRYDILLSIAKFLHQQNLKLDNLFILLIQKEDLRSFTILQEFSYTYFLHELFLDNIDYTQVKRLIQEYNDSKQLLNWSEVGLHSKQDDLSEKRVKIFQNKDKASNYFEYVCAYHIRVFTFFDKKKSQMQYFDEYQTSILKQQIWSDLNQGSSFNTYNDYIKDQETHLLIKIEQIQKQEIHNKLIEENKEFQNILLIGKSQVGKSSLIEQLTGQKGLRGSGERSETQICNIYRVDYGNVVYRFIDTPGYEGTENNQCPYHNFKIIGDYLRRQDINEFKLLFMINKDFDNRDTMSKVLKDFFIFIENIFDQDVSFIDSDYLEHLYQDNSEGERIRNEKMLQNKIFQIFRNDSGDEIDTSEEKFEHTVFNSNYMTRQGLYKIEEEQDKAQQKQLFEKINNIECVGLEDKVLFKIKKYLSQNIISQPEVFMAEFEKIAGLHLQLREYISNISENRVRQNTQINIQQLKKEKLEIVQQLKRSQFFVVGAVYSRISEGVQESQFSEKIKNDALRHFLPIQYTSALFEITEEKPESMLISRKQHYYSLLAHQLSKFININEEKYQIELEILAELKLAQEICNQNIEHQKYIENNYDKNSGENIQELQKLSQFFSDFQTSGITVYRNISLVSLVIKTLLPYSKVNFILDAIMIPLLAGYDIYTYFKGYICSRQFVVNSVTNILSLGCLALFLIPGVGFLAGIASGFVLILGNSISSLMHTSSDTFDQTIGLNLPKIMQDIQPNQHLKYYEGSQLLEENFKITNYSQLKQKEAYNMFRELEKDNFESNKLVLTQLFQTQQNEDLKNLVTNYIVTNYILRNIQEISQYLQQNNEECNKFYLNRVIQQLTLDQQQVKTYYNKSKEINQIKNNYDKLIFLMKLKLEKEQAQNIQQQMINFSEQEKTEIEQFLNNIKLFCQTNSQQEQTTYQNQSELADGVFRIDNRFQILFDCYCNLTYLKAKQKLKQPTIKQILKDTDKMIFVVNTDQQHKIFDLLMENQNSQVSSIYELLNITDNYIVNRYLQQQQEQNQLNLTFLAKNEILGASPLYSIDLHDIASNSIDEKQFLQNVEQELQKQEENANNKQTSKLQKVDQNQTNGQQNQEIEKQQVNSNDELTSEDQKVDQNLIAEQQKVDEVNPDIFSITVDMSQRLRHFYQSVKYLRNYFTSI